MTYYEDAQADQNYYQEVLDSEPIGFRPTHMPSGSQYHDHLCTCPSCNGDGPDEWTPPEEYADIMEEEENELHIGERVVWNPEVYDDEVVTLRNDLKGQPVTVIQIVHDGPDYIVASDTGETFPVRSWMITRLDGSPID